MQHYANYRAKIRRMSDDSAVVPPTDIPSDNLDSVEAADIKPFYPAPPIAPSDENYKTKKTVGPNPFKQYLRRRRKVVVYQVIVFLILAAIFTTWMIFLIRKG